MSAPAWMPLYIADYLADTMHLTAQEHGAYMLLMMAYWRNGGLPTDERQLARIAGLTDEEWSLERPVLAAFFRERWRHKRIDAELAKAAELSHSGRLAGLASAKARSTKRQRSGNGTANGLATERQPSPSPSPEEETSSSFSEIAPRARTREEPKRKNVAERLERELRDDLGEHAPPQSADFGPIAALLEDGHDPVKDILVGCRLAASKTTDPIGSWQYYAVAISRRPKANGTGGEAMVWLPADSPQWATMDSRSRVEKRRPLIARGSTTATGLGAFVPAAWLEPTPAMRKAS